MEFLVPRFQIEIKFTPLLNFSSIGKEVLSNFVSEVQTLNVLGENTINESIVLDYDQYNRITLNFLSLILFTEGPIFHLSESNSFIEHPLLDILNQLKTVRGWGNINKVLYYGVFVKIQPDKSNEQVIQEFKTMYFNQSVNDIFGSEPKDYAFTIKNKIRNSEVYVEKGPYSGIKDLKAKKAVPKDPEMNVKLQGVGEGTIITIADDNPAFSFSSFKENLNYIKQILQVK